MSLESFNFIDSLNASNPTTTDNVSEGDDHIRGIKSTLKTTFPSINAAITATDEEINLLDGVTATTAELNYTDGVTSNIQTQLGTKLPLAGGTMTGDVSLGTNVKAKFGASDDLQIYSDGSNSIIRESGAGALYLDATNLNFRSSNFENYITCAAEAAVTLYHDNLSKLATTSTGIDVTGSVTCDGFTSTGIDDNATSTAITIDASENVGIGETNPRTSLHVKSVAGNFLEANGNSNFTGTAINIGTNATTGGINSKYGAITWGEISATFPQYQHAAITAVQDGADVNQTGLAFHVHNSTSRSVDLAETVRFPSTGGITFNGDTAAANALDDYEEGTWTPAINAGAVSYTAQRGRYTKIGNKVLIEGLVHINTITTTSSYSIILGLPFASSATYYSGLTTKVNGFNWGGSATMLTFQVQPSTTHISAAGAYNNGGFNDVNANGLAAGDWISVTGAYTV